MQKNLHVKDRLKASLDENVRHRPKLLYFNYEILINHSPYLLVQSLCRPKYKAIGFALDQVLWAHQKSEDLEQTCV